jgi:hypothetical protein
LVLHRVVEAEEVLMRVGCDPTIELVIKPPQDDAFDAITVELDGADEIAELAETLEAEWTAARPELRRLMKMPETEELWGGWPEGGEEAAQ